MKLEPVYSMFLLYLINKAIDTTVEGHGPFRRVDHKPLGDCAYRDTIRDLSNGQEYYITIEPRKD